MTHTAARQYAVCCICALALSPVGCSESVVSPHTPATRAQAIVNGSADPLVVDLTQGQRLAIGWLHVANQVSANFCTGTLIAPRVVVTASHCTEGSDADEIGFGVGRAPSSATASFDVVEIHEHWWHDMALLVLDEDATVAVPDLTVIAANVDPLSNGDIGRPLDAAGYGDTYGTNPAGRWFARVYLADVDSTTIVVDGRGEQGICYGDSGGPVLWERSDGRVVVVAVESYGDASCVDRDTMTRLDALFDDFVAPVIDAQPASDPCGGVDYLGRCDGDTVEWCDGGVLYQRDCATLDTSCGWIDGDIGYDCTCGNLDYLGRCDGDLVEWCDGGRYAAVDCSSNSEHCGWVDQDTGYFCVDSPATSNPGSDVPTTNDRPTEPTSDPVAEEPPVEAPDPEPSYEPEPSTLDEAVETRRPDGPEAVGCQQAPGSSSSTALLFGLLLLVVGTFLRN